MPFNLNIKLNISYLKQQSIPYLLSTTTFFLVFFQEREVEVILLRI